MFRALVALAFLLSFAIPPPIFAAQEADDPSTAEETPVVVIDAPECVPGHVGAQPVDVCLYTDGRAIAWRSSIVGPTSLALRPPGAHSWIFDQPITAADCDAPGSAMSVGLGSACFDLFADGLGSPLAAPAPTGSQISPPPTATPETTYETRKGPKTSAQLLNELSTAGYNGPWEISAMLAAYDRATAQAQFTPPAAAPAPAAVSPQYPDWRQGGPSCAALAYIVSPGYIRAQQQLLEDIKAGRMPRPIPADAFTYTAPPCVDRTGYPSGWNGSISCAQLPFTGYFTLGSGPQDHCTGRVNP